MMIKGKGDNWREFWGYGFHLTPEHVTAEQLRPMMFQYDKLATECLDSLDRFPTPEPEPETKDDGVKATETPGSNEPNEPKKKGHRDLYELLKKHADEDEKLGQLWTELNTVPEWVDWDQIDRGQRVFYRYAAPAIVSLTFQSLLGGMGSRRIVEVLTRTGGFGAKVTRRRLLQTFQHILDVTKDLDSLKPDGKGFASSVRVRLLHASVRRRIMALAAQRPGYFDMDEWGVPISDLDSIGTTMTFSATLIWIGLPRQGIYMREAEIVDYIALWRYVAYILGVSTDVFATPHTTRVFMESLLLSEIDPSETSQTLANNIIAGLHSQPPVYASADFLRAQAHWLNGPDLAGALAVKRPPLYYSVLMAGQCFFFMALCYGYRSVASWDDANIRRLRSMLHRLTLEQTDKKEAKHEFEWVPSLDVPSTALGVVGDGNGFWSVGTSVERGNLQALLAAGVAVGALVWFGARASGLLQML